MLVSPFWAISLDSMATIKEINDYSVGSVPIPIAEWLNSFSIGPHS